VRPELHFGRTALCLLFVSSAASAQEPPEEPVDVYVYGAPAPESTYKARQQVTGTRSTRDPAEVPQALSVVPRTLLEDTVARRTDEALPLVPSVQLGAGFGSVWDDYTVRGFRVWAGTMYRNGYLMGYSGLGASDTVNVERIEVLRGSTASLYGPGLPGGTVNLVTKQPLFSKHHAEVGLGFGSFDTKRASFDLTGPLAAERVAYRFTGSYDDTDGFRDFNDSERIVLNPAVALRLGRTRVLWEVQFFRMRYRPDPIGVPTVDGDPFRLPVERSYIEPHAPRTDFRGGLAHVEARHELSPDVELRLGVQRQAGFLNEPAIVALGIDPDGRTLQRLATHFTSHSEDITVQLGIGAGVRTGSLWHDLTLGADFRYEVVDWLIEIADPTQPFAIDLFAPVYGQPLPAVQGAAPPSNQWDYALAGVYVSDRVEVLPELAFTLGGRADWYNQTSVAPGVDEEKGELAPSGRAGVLFEPLPVLTAYASVSRGFWPVVGVSATGSLLEPETNVGFELGARFALPRDPLTVDVGVFRIDNRNISVPDPERPDFQIQRGEARSQGVEVETTARLADTLRGIASYAFNDAEVTADPNPALVGRRLPFVAEHSGALWLQWQAPVRGLGLGAGALLVGERSLNDGAEIPGYARVDAVGAYQLGAAKLALRLENLFDTRYVRSGNDASSIFYGAPRSALLMLALRN